MKINQIPKRPDPPSIHPHLVRMGDTYLDIQAIQAVAFTRKSTLSLAENEPELIASVVVGGAKMALINEDAMKLENLLRNTQPEFRLPPPPPGGN